MSVARDITRRKADEARLKALLAQQEALLDNALIGIVLLRQRVIIQCNRRFEELFGYDEGEMLGQRTEILYPTEEFYEAIGEAGLHRAGPGRVVPRRRLVQAQGRQPVLGLFERQGRWICRNPDAGSVWICADLTEQKRDQERSQLAASVFESTTEGIMITDTDHAILAVNRAFTEITGYTDQEVVGKNPSLLSSGRQPPGVLSARCGNAAPGRQVARRNLEPPQERRYLSGVAVDQRGAGWRRSRDPLRGRVFGYFGAKARRASSCRFSPITIR